MREEYHPLLLALLVMGESVKEFMERHIKELVKRFVKQQLGAKAQKEAMLDFEDPFEPEVP